MGIEAYYAERDRLQRLDAEAAAKGSNELAQLAPLHPVESPGAPYVAFPTANLTLKERAIKYALTPLKLTLEGTQRTTSAFREALLWAGGETTTQGFKDRFKAALDGDKTVSGREFAEFLIGRDTLEVMDKDPFIPGWMKAVSAPEHVAAGTPLSTEKEPVVTLGDAFSTAVDLVVDPFALLSLTPAGLGSKASGALGKALTKVPGILRARNALEYVFGPSSHAPWAAVHLLRDPENVLTGPLRPAYEELRFAVGTTSKRMEESMGAAYEASKVIEKDRGARQRIGAWLHKQEAVQVNGVWTLTGKRGLPKLTGDEEHVAHALKGIVEDKMAQLKAAGHLKDEEIGEGLEKIMPVLAGRDYIPMDIWQSWTVRDLGRISLRMRNGDAMYRKVKGGKRLIRPTMEDFDGIESVENFLYVAERKLGLEPTLLKWAPRPGYRKTNPILAQASPWQRRYLTDLVNRFQGKGRGRKHIMFDLQVAEMISKAKEAPGGGRVISLMEKLNGGRTVDGFADFSPTTKLAGLFTHNIIRATLGLRLRSALQNTTQILNYAVAKGMPATLKGMFKMSSREFGLARKEERLLGDFQAFWKDDFWTSRYGQAWDRVLFAPFNAAENVIRGTGFNIGLDEAMKKFGARSLDDLKRMGKLQEALNHAHLQSVEGAFMYGILGRSPVLASNPLTRVGLTLLSYPYKQAEFLRRTFARDGSALMRFIGLHGYLINNLNEYAGVAAEDFLGWGFKPMTRSFAGVPIATSPPMKVLLDTSEALQAYAAGDNTLAERKFQDALKTMPLVFNPGLPYLAVKDVFGTPMDEQGLVDKIRTKRQEIGEDFVPISTKEAVTNFLIARSTTQRMRAELHRRQARAIKKIDWFLDKRAKAVVDAVLDPSRDGDGLAKAAFDFASGIEIEGKLFFPSAEMFDGRIKRQFAKRTVSRDVREMLDHRFLNQVYLAAQLELLTRVQESGGAPVSLPKGRGPGR